MLLGRLGTRLVLWQPLTACNTPSLPWHPPHPAAWLPRIAARKCRAKKNALMSELQGTLAGLVRKNDEYKMQVGGDGIDCRRTPGTVAGCLASEGGCWLAVPLKVQVWQAPLGGPA